MVGAPGARASWRSLYPFESHHLERDGVRMHYLDEGQGEPVVMLHGNPTWSFHFRNLVKGLRDTHRVIVPDHVGCGLSDKPQDYPYRLRRHVDNLEALVEHLDLPAFNLVMHDWGGAIGMGLAARHPERVKRLCLFNTAAYRSARMPLGLAVARLPLVGDLLIRGLNAFVRGALLTAAHRRDRLTPEVRAGYLAPYDSWRNRIATLRFVQDIPMAPDHPSYRALLEAECGLPKQAGKPILIVWGARDWVFDDRFLDRWREIWPDADVRRLDDAGHFVVEDAHERILPWLRDLLARPA